MTVPNNYKVSVEFLDVDLEAAFDFLYLDDTYFSTNPGKSFTSASEVLDVGFISDRNTAGRGFLLRLSSVDVSGLLISK